jgi:chemotaxis protein methyltransferase CheR
MTTQAGITEICADNYRFLQDHVYTHAGIIIDEDKHYLLETRLAPIVRQLGLASINDLCALIKATREPEIGWRVVEAMTTNETYFFRDPSHYEAIRTTLIPRLRSERADTRRLRFWSAAASTGQEAYSLAMLLMEQDWTGWDVQILGTDLSSQVLERARAGRYHQIEVNRGLPAAMLLKHFRKWGADWQINDSVRRMVRFESVDLRCSMRTLGPFDLVFCRNVLIYFDAATKKNVMEQLYGTLFRGGWLLVGGAETAFGADELFERRAIGGATLYVAR